ncbi:unnamed protein product [Heligmosomoides polygyrus]|uniref:SWIRM domain-containing protein n=1 Tax=Heligmosomoides polygyrus TaxID=6339 RepID=A0A183GTR1_HELPZ|nr:unnamed protein product [Heligmosomoides polygyrus]
MVFKVKCSDKRLVRRIHSFLQRCGYINFGNFHRLASTFLKNLIIIGAGADGIAALKQLHYFGFDVVLLEARVNHLPLFTLKNEMLMNCEGVAVFKFRRRLPRLRLVHLISFFILNEQFYSKLKNQLSE